MAFEQLVVLFVVIFLIEKGHSDLCPCEDQSLCNPVDYSGKEVFAFMVKDKRSDWELFDWTKLTTIIMCDFYDPELMCFAHKNNVRVVWLAYPEKELLLNDNEVDKWISSQLKYSKDRFLDGINIDIEYAIDSGSQYVDGLSKFMSKLSNKFHSAQPNSQVTFDVPWAPYNAKGKGVDGRNYNFTDLAQTSDFLFIMAYDEQSQIFGTDCTARANSDLFSTADGILAYIKLGIDPNKLVLGLPWYGYFYKCIKTGSKGSDVCFISEVPFRGENCSNVAGTQITYRDIQFFIKMYGSYYDENSATKYIWYHDTDGFVKTIWYDDSKTLSHKIGIAFLQKLRGIGMWNANNLDYSGGASSKAMIADMWGIFPDYKKSYFRKHLNI